MLARFYSSKASSTHLSAFPPSSQRLHVRRRRAGRPPRRRSSLRAGPTSGCGAVEGAELRSACRARRGAPCRARRTDRLSSRRQDVRELWWRRPGPTVGIPVLGGRGGAKVFRPPSSSHLSSQGRGRRFSCEPATALPPSAFACASHRSSLLSQRRALGFMAGKGGRMLIAERP